MNVEQRNLKKSSSLYEEGNSEREKMGFEPGEPQSSPTLKLSLLSLPKHLRQPSGHLTPPLQTKASIPFQWEEAPGKPKPMSKPKAARCLDLPPRLVIVEGKLTDTPSPTTVLDGPYSGGRVLSHTMSFSYGKASFRISEGRKQIGKEKLNFSSWRYENIKEDYGDDSGGILDFSSPIDGFPESFPKEAKITRVKKKNSFFGSSKSNFWTSIYEGVKHAVPWRRKQEKVRTTD